MMLPFKSLCLPFFGACVGWLATASPLAAEEWQLLFDGKTLDGWSGDPRLWRVEDGSLVGETDQDRKKANENTFLIWQGGEVEDFEFAYRARVGGDNNSGVQYRSKVLDAQKWTMAGYQMDLHPDPRYLGMLYEEKGRGIACESGQQVELADQPKVTGSFGRPETDLTKWNEYRVVAKGPVLRHFINGKQVAEIHDVHPSRRSLRGSLGLQLHAGPPMKVEFRDLRLRPLPHEEGPGASAAQRSAVPNPEWIWLHANPKDNERVFLRREFRLPPDVESASLILTCDNWQQVWVNGRDLGSSGEWRTPVEHDLSALVRPGAANVIAVEARNEDGRAGMAMRFTAQLKGGRRIHFVSDDKWLASAEAAGRWQNPGYAATGWQPAVKVASMGDAPWGEVISGERVLVPVDVTAEYQVAPDFRMERLYQVPKEKGSWVAMTVDEQGRLYCSDQYGGIHRVTPAAGAEEETVVESLNLALRGAQGLLWHQGALYVTVNEGEDQSGVWMVTDSNRDGVPDQPQLIKAMTGRGEHGPHALVLSPDGKWIYFIAGNFTDLAEMDSSLPATSWAEDQLLPRRPDAKGHAWDRMAPGGWIARFRPGGKDWQLFATGFRNPYDMAFNEYGDLFAYDADMEYDFGMPWYRPTRICHVVPGAEFGWRNGTGKWPEYYEDSMDSQLDIGPGSPTGVVSGKGARFPAKYQRAIFAFDWTYATIHAIHLTPQGRGYRAEREEFVAGSGLPLTDGVIGKDGALYFLTGGRRTASVLWRVRYAGGEPVEPVPYRSKPLELMDASKAWEGLGSEDRLTRYESRLALEAAGSPANLANQLKRETDPWRTIGGTLALARTGSAAQKKAMLDALDRLDWAALDRQQRLNWLRACGLIFARHGEPAEAERQRVLAKIDAAYPSDDWQLDRELCRMLSYLQAPGVVGRTLALMDNAPLTPAPDWLGIAKRNAQYGADIENMVAHQPPAQVIHYIYCLRVVKGPWSEQERKRFFAWFDVLREKTGGMSYMGFINDLRKQTLETATPEEREWLEKWQPAAPPSHLQNLPKAAGPGRAWTLEEVEALAAEGLQGRDRENGKRMFQASLCAACHRFGAEGGSAGPDLTAVAGRFSVRDLAEAIIDPSKVVSDQFAFELITKKDGSQVIGKVMEEKQDHIVVATSAFDFSHTEAIEKAQIKEVKISPISPMPPALINQLNAEELKDLLAYLLGEKE